MKRIIVSPQAEIALRSLAEDDLRRIHFWFDALKNWDDDEFVRKNSKPLESVAGVFVLHTTGNFRIFFQIDPETVTIVDVATKSAILTSAGLMGVVETTAPLVPNSVNQ
jgi:mRNA-degrading endonuclease RelE of RelBE toxin-antitoxin system